MPIKKISFFIRYRGDLFHRNLVGQICWIVRRYRTAGSFSKDTPMDALIYMLLVRRRVTVYMATGDKIAR